MTSEQTTPLPRKRAYLIFAVVGLALLMSSLDATIVAVGIPTMMRELKTNLAWIGWTLTSFQLTQTIVMPLAGKLSDDWGRKRLFLGSVVLFTLSSIAAALAPNVYVLIIFRVLQAVGGGAFMPSATGIVGDAFGKHRRAAIGLFASIFPIGGMLGPNIGGFIIDHFDWRWIFLVNGPIGLGLVLLGLVVLPAGVAAPSQRRVDVKGVALFAVAMVAVLYAMTTAGEHPEEIGHPMLWLFLLVGLAVVGLFLWHESRTPAPMMELGLLRWRPFLAANVYNFMFGAAVFGFFSFIPYYATIGYGMSATESGAVLTPRSITMMVVSLLSSLFLIRFGYRLPMIVGASLVSLGLFVLSRGYHDVAFQGLQIPNVLLLVLPVMLAGAGLGMANPASNNAALDLIPEKMAAVAGLRGMFRSLGGVIGTAAFIMVLSRYEDKVVGMERIFLALTFVMLLVVVAVFFIPDLAHERRAAREWNKQEQVEGA